MRIKTLLMLSAAALAWKMLSDRRGGSARAHQEHDLDVALDDTFPASDPPAMTSPASTTASVRADTLRRKH